MELSIILAFIAGVVGGGLVFSLGVIAGIAMIKAHEYALRSAGPAERSEEVEIFDEEHFERAQLGPEEGGLEFDSSQELDDDFLKELAELNRHSS